MKKILTTTAMVAMTAGSAFAFDSTATDLDAEVKTANDAIAVIDVAVTFERFNADDTVFTPALPGATDTISNSITPTDVIQYAFNKDDGAASFSLSTSNVSVPADAENIKDAVNGVNSAIQTEFYGTITSGANLTTAATVGIVGEMIQTFNVDIPLLNTYATDNLVTATGTPGTWTIFDNAATDLGENLKDLNTTITNVDLALTATNAG